MTAQKHNKDPVENLQWKRGRDSINKYNKCLKKFISYRIKNFIDLTPEVLIYTAKWVEEV